MGHSRPAPLTASLLLFWLASPLAVNAQEGEWRQWGGPRGDFMVESEGLAETWPETGPPELWSRSLGAGHTSILVADGRLFTMYRESGSGGGEPWTPSESVIAMDAATMQGVIKRLDGRGLIARRADPVVVAGPAADADVLGHRDLHVVDVIAIPDRLVELVGEAQRQEGQRRHEQAAKDGTYSELRTEADESKAIPMPMKAGECLFFSCWTLHKSEPNRSDRDRRILFMRYSDADAVEVYNDRTPRLGRLLRGTTRFEGVKNYEADI